MLLAKRIDRDERPLFQTLEGHTEDALKVLRSYFDQQWDIVQGFCSRWEIEPELFARNAFLSIGLHDVGKAISPFQKRIREGKHSSDYPHPFFAIPIVLEIFRGLDVLLPDVKVPSNPDISVPLVEILAVAGHHSQLYHGLYQDLNVQADFLKDVKNFGKQIKRMYYDLEFRGLFGVPSNIEQIFEDFKPPPWKGVSDVFISQICQRGCHNYANKVKLKSVFTYFFSLLKLCDITASSQFEAKAKAIQSELCDSVIEDDFLYQHLPHMDLDEILGDAKPYKYQENMVKSSDPFALLLSPCGRGKTKAAVAWGLRIAELNNLNRMVFAMPTQVTSNAMKETLSELFGKDYVGLYHGRSFSELKCGTDSDELDYGKLRDENFQGEVFLKPVTVTTVDHLLYSFLHGFSQADFALGNLQTSCIIFDEVHCYERLLLSHLKLLFRTLREMKIPHLLMSGTFPQFLRNELSRDSAEAYIPFQDNEGLYFEPFVLTKRDYPIINQQGLSKLLGEEVRENHQSGKRQFIILNTVDRAQQLYKALRGLIPVGEIELLHSRFTYRHRRAKEKRILEARNAHPYILVATQVIEVSLDISSDLMYTELAPADALGQRGGRLNRGSSTCRENDFIHKMTIFKPGSSLPYKEVENIVNKTWEILSEGPMSYHKIKQLSDYAYQGYTLGSSEFLHFFEMCSLLGFSHREIRFSEEEGKMFQTRQKDFVTINVIPEAILGNEEDSLQDENMVAVPYWWYATDSKENNENPRYFYTRTKKTGNIEHPYLICRIPYDEEVGFDYELRAEVERAGDNII